MLVSLVLTLSGVLFLNVQPLVSSVATLEEGELLVPQWWKRESATLPQAGASVQMFLSRCVTLLIPRRTIAFVVVLCHSGLRNMLCRTPRIVPRLCRACDLLRLLLLLPVPGWVSPTIRAGWSTGIQGMCEQGPCVRVLGLGLVVPPQGMTVLRCSVILRGGRLKTCMVAPGYVS